MSLRLADNEWGFSVADNNPFRIFRILQPIARDSVGVDGVIDLSRGDPGYGFTPGIRARRFIGYLLFLDTILNTPQRRMVNDYCKPEHYEALWDTIHKATLEEYGAAAAERNLADLTFFMNEVSALAVGQGLPYTPYKVLFETFKFCTVSGGTYHDPIGEEMVRAIVAWWHQKTVSTPIDYRDLIFVNGASHAIGTLFKLLGEEGIGFLRPHDRVLITSPVYSPYNSILESRQIDVFSLEIDPITGDIAEYSEKEMEAYPNDIKAILLIDPNNPTGFSMSVPMLEAIGAFAKRKNALIITDEVYSSFFKDKKTMIDICPERTIRINARSKIERSTGLRFGDVLVAKAGQKYIMEHILRDYVKSNTSWNDLFMAAKGPGGILGEFQHTTFVPGPSQMLGAAHIILGKEERAEYREAVGDNMTIFSSVLGLPHKGNMYYIIFDLNEVEGCNKQHVPMEEKLVQLAQRGIVYIQSNHFFSEKDRMAKDRRNTVRASVVNTSAENIRKAAEITKADFC